MKPCERRGLGYEPRRSLRAPARVGTRAGVSSNATAVSREGRGRSSSEPPRMGIREGASSNADATMRVVTATLEQAP
jgi:hypothetical protein